MVRKTILPHTSLWREDASQWRAPLEILNRPTGTDQTPRSAKSPSRCSSSLRVLRRQGAAKHKPARRQAAKLFYRIGPLTPSARSANLIAGDGTKNGFPAPNKEPATNQKIRLDRKSPIQVRIHLPPAESHANSRSQGGSLALPTQYVGTPDPGQQTHPPGGRLGTQ